MDTTVREARPADVDDVASFTQETWPERDGGDYLPDVFSEWVESEDPSQHTLVAEADGEAVGTLQVVMLSEYEAWCQGMRVHPEYRGRGISKRLTHDGFDWAHEQGAVVARNMVFSWNAQGLGASRAAGYDPATEFRWVQPEPDPDARPDDEITSDPDAAWNYWTDNGARTALRGLALDRGESWALSELTRETLAAAAAEDGLFVVRDGGVSGFAYRVREAEYDDVRQVEYGVGVWDDVETARSLFDAIARDAGERGRDVTRVLVPEDVGTVSDAARVGIEISDEPDFVLAADLTGE